MNESGTSVEGMLAEQKSVNLRTYKSKFDSSLGAFCSLT